MVVGERRRAGLALQSRVCVVCGMCDRAGPMVPCSRGGKACVCDSERVMPGGLEGHTGRRGRVAAAEWWWLRW